MNYWLTTQWPPREDNPDLLPSGVWLPDGREAAGNCLREGDLVLIYQSQTGRTEIRRRPDGTQERVRSLVGKGGIIAIGRVCDRLSEREGSTTTEYENGTSIWWRWWTPIELLSRSGFVPRVELNGILGYDPTYSLRGFGDRKSGLKRIAAQQYHALVDIFRSQRPNVLPPFRTSVRRGGRREGTEAEGEEHRRLKEYVASNPSEVLGERGMRHLHTEYLFPTGDQADVVLEDHIGRIVGVEVEVSVTDEQNEGMLQAIKYRRMLEPLTEREMGCRFSD